MSHFFLKIIKILILKPQIEKYFKTFFFIKLALIININRSLLTALVCQKLKRCYKKTAYFNVTSK